MQDWYILYVCRHRISGFLLILLINFQVDGSAGSVCQGRLAFFFPERYPECYCVIAGWNEWEFVDSVANSSCASGRSHNLQRTGYYVSDRLCTKGPPLNRTSYCEYDIAHAKRSLFTCH